MHTELDHQEITRYMDKIYLNEKTLTIVTFQLPFMYEYSTSEYISSVYNEQLEIVGTWTLKKFKGYLNKGILIEVSEEEAALWTM